MGNGNYIQKNYTGDKMIISRAVAEMLNSYTPKGCPFPNYTLLDLLKDMVRMYSWRVEKDTSLSDFVEMLMENEAHLQAYGADILSILDTFS